MAAALCGAALACTATAPPEPPLAFLGEAIIEPEPAIAGEPTVGGLSSIAHVGRDRYYAISDDRGEHGPARHYVLKIDLDAGALSSERVEVVEWRPLHGVGGEPFAVETYDLEGLVALDQTLFVTSEGDAARGVEPFVGVFGPDGHLMETLGLPPGLAPAADAGVRDNLALESLAITPDARFLFTGTESALVQDGPVSTSAAGATARLLRFDRDRGVFDAQFAYPVDPLHASPPHPGGHSPPLNGLSELLALSEMHLLALERGFVAGAAQPQSVKLFDVCLQGATDISSIGALASTDVPYTPASKRLVADLVDLVPRLDNVEGMTFGPSLPDGRQTLVFVSDDNFAPQRQVTQILAFAVAADAIRGCSEQ